MIAEDSLVHFPHPRPRATVRLFCFPYTGAGVRTYQEFARQLPERIEVAGVRLPVGCARMPELVHRLAGAVAPRLDLPSAFFGHGMGAHIAFELARTLARRGIGPDRLLVSGCPAPRNGAGEPEELPADLSAIRSDLTVAQTHRCGPVAPLTIPIHAFLGVDDPIAGNEQMAEWLTRTTRYATIVRLAGDHFFINSERARLLSAIATAIGTGVTA